MVQVNLNDVLQTIIQEHGYELVHDELHRLKPIESAQTSDFGILASADPALNGQKSKGSSKITAPQYVSKMDLPIDKEPLVAAIAERFQGKTFLPTIGDIGNFCQIYGITMPASRTRANVIPRLFKFIAAMESDDIGRLLNDGAFSGPSRLGPIADAIRRNGRAS